MNDKNKLINYSLILLLLAILIYLLYPSAKEELPEKIPQKEVKQTLKEPIHIDTIEIIELKQKPKDNIKTPIIQQQSKVIEEKSQEILPTIEKMPTILATAKTKGSKFIIKLISDKKIISNPSQMQIRYIPIRGILEEDDNQYNFKFSLQEEYSNNSDATLTIQVVSISKDFVLECDGSILKYLDRHNIYELKIDMFNFYASCYINGEKEMPDFDSLPKPEIKLENLPPELLKMLEERKQIN